MADSAEIRCLGCREWIAGDERVAEFVEPLANEPGDNLTVDRPPKYAHAEHAEFPKARGYAPTNRTGILDELREFLDAQQRVSGGSD
jgi:hypothetical protein